MNTLHPIKAPKASYVNSIPIRHGELTVVTSDHAEATMRHSSRLAADVQQAGVGVLLINCGMSDRRFREHFNTKHREVYRDPRLLLNTQYNGNLASESTAIDQIITHGEIGVVILAGWEFASDTYRKRQRLLTYLRKLMAERGIAVIVYAHTASEPVAGRIDHGGLGKLTLLSFAVAKIEASEVLEVAAEQPKPVVATTPEEYRELVRSAHDFGWEVNELAAQHVDEQGVLCEVA